MRTIGPVQAILILLYADGIAVTVNLRAQTNITTNYVTSHPSFRVVNGQLYNTEKSSQWRTVWALPGLPNIIPQTVSNGVFCEEGSFRRGADDFEPLVKGLLVTNWSFPQPEKYKPFMFRAMRTGTLNHTCTNVFGVPRTVVLDVWDCGVPHVAAVVRTNIVTTNSPSKKR